jgi:endonuclease/exonuclease/phosphatase family metal-dependent hydrolase
VTPSAVTAKIHQYNICNAYRPVCTLTQTATAMDVLKYLAVADGAWMISINEICLQNFYALTEQLNTDGSMVISKQSEDGCGGQAFGNAILHPGAIRRDSAAWYLSNPGRDCATMECRTMLCLKFDTYAGPMGQCTAHLGADTKEHTIFQAAEYIYISSAWMGTGYRFSLAGDFNLVRGDLPQAYDAFVDLVAGYTHPIRDENGARTPNKQIDFVFVQKVGSWTLKSPYCPTNASDHCHASGEWRPLGG